MGAADGVIGAVFRDTVRFTGELDAGTLTVKKFLMGTSTEQPSTSTSTSTKYPISDSGCIQHRDMMFDSRVGFSGSADLMVQLSNSRNPRWRLKLDI